MNGEKVPFKVIPATTIFIPISTQFALDDEDAR